METETVTAGDAIRYALQANILILVAATLAGGGLLAGGVAVLGRPASGAAVTVKWVLVLGAFIAGLALQTGGTIGLLYKVIRDATR